MRMLAVGSAVAAGLAIAAGTAMLAAPGQQRPGEMTQAHVWIDNRSPDQAVPVVVTAPGTMNVQVVGTPRVAIDSSSVVTTRAVRQSWEYRTISVATGQDIGSALQTAGVQGWEAVGFQPVQAGVTVLLKRPN